MYHYPEPRHPVIMWNLNDEVSCPKRYYVDVLRGTYHPLTVIVRHGKHTFEEEESKLDRQEAILWCKAICRLSGHYEGENG